MEVLVQRAATSFGSSVRNMADANSSSWSRALAGRAYALHHQLVDALWSQMARTSR